MAKAQSFIEFIVTVLILGGAFLFFVRFLLPYALVVSVVFQAVALASLFFVALLFMFFGGGKR